MKFADERRCRRAAFTMIEVMAAVVILSVGLVLILQSLSLGIRNLTYAQNRFLAASIAAEKLADLEEEELKNSGLDESSALQEKVTKRNKNFEVTIEVKPQLLDLEKFPQRFLPGEEPAYYPKIEDIIRKVSVRIEWQERAAPQQLVLSTYLNAKQKQ
ncbi:MAG: prepilin-type N-terminal cleavage/methylation domain-containing protein [Candidatus Omnitrophota bacterium]